MPYKKHFRRKKGGARKRRGRLNRGPSIRGSTIQLANPRPMKSQLVKFVYNNRNYLKPNLVAALSPTLGFTIRLNSVTGLFNRSAMGPTGQENWQLPFTGAGLGPQYPHLANWAAKYNHFQVLGTKVTFKIKAAIEEHNDQAPSKILIVKHSSTNNTGQVFSQSNKYFETVPFTPYAKVRDIQQSYMQTKGQQILSMSYSPSKFHGVRKSAISADSRLIGQFLDQTATAITNPVEDAYLTFMYMNGLENESPNRNQSRMIVDVRIESIVKLTEPRLNTVQQDILGDSGWGGTSL